MQAIVYSGSGYYQSAVFGKYVDTRQADNFQYDTYYIVLDKEKKRLVKVRRYSVLNDRDEDELLVSLILLGYEPDDWIKKEALDATTYLPDWIIPYSWDNDIQNAAMIEKCQMIDSDVVLIGGSVKDRTNERTLMSATDDLKNAHILSLTYQNGNVKMILTGMWGCKVEITLVQPAFYQVKYGMHNWPLEGEKSLWDTALIFIDDDLVCLYDDGKSPYVDEFTDYSLMRADDILFKIIPNAL